MKLVSSYELLIAIVV